MRILEPPDRGSQPRIQRVLEGRQCFATEFSGVGTACQAHIIIETYFRECNVYFRTIRQSLGVGVAWLAHFIVETHSQEYNVHFRIMREMLATPDPESRKFFQVEFSGVAMA